jgi:hypothetical protein
MLDYLKPFEKEDYDFFIFTPTQKEEQIHIEVGKYDEYGEDIEGSEVGKFHHIITFKIDEEEEKIKNLDQVDAILGSPLEYMSMIIPLDFYGVICKKTTKSEGFVKKIFDNLKEQC